MAQQRVKFKSYLTKIQVSVNSLGTQSFEAVLLPKEAEILKVDVEVLEAAKQGTTLNVGFAKNENFFIDIADISSVTNHSSSKVTSTNKNETITLKLNKESDKGLIVLRVFYFLPSEIVAEF